MRDELARILAQARTVTVDELPRLLGDLEELRATALVRLMAHQSTQSEADEMLDVSEAAECMGVSTTYLYHRAKGFPFTRRVGRKLLFSSNGLDAHLRKSR